MDTSITPLISKSKSVSSPQKTSSSLLSKFKKASGFTKTSNFVLFLCTAGTFAIFCLYRTQILSPRIWKSQVIPSDWYFFKDGYRNFALRLHLWSVIPAGILLPTQFIPSIRRRWPRLHRIGGRFLVLLLLLGNISAIIISFHAFTGTIATITSALALGFMTTVCAFKSYRGILTHRIDVHRTYMIRAWAYTGAILSMRPIMVAVSFAITILSPDGFFSVYTCSQLESMYEPFDLSTIGLLQRYPACAAPGSGDVKIIVPARFSSAREEWASVLGVTFGVAVWIAILLHVLATEWYLSTTLDEDEKLKKASELRRRMREAEK